ncbi:MAG: MOSC domain-containing protein [Pseudomonadota bacterium]
MSKRPSPLDRFARDLPPGELEWIGVRPARKVKMESLDRAEAVPGYGLEGDHRTEKKPGSGRQVTVISREFIDQIAYFLSREAIDPALLRRNLVVSGINLNALRHQRFRIGQAVFEAGVLCHPCSRMESALGKGGVAAMIGHGGLCCKIIEGGWLSVGDAVEVVAPGQNLDLFAAQRV